MAETQAWRASRMRADAGPAPMTTRSARRSPRMGLRLWTLLNAQALIHGSPAGPCDAAFVEDDARRFAARRAS